MMTTPERFRRRQRIEAAFIVLLGIAGGTWIYLDENEEEEQQACIVRSFRDLSEALDARSALTARDYKLTVRADRLDRKKERAVSRVVDVAATAADNPRTARIRFDRALKAYRADSAYVARERVEVRAERAELAQIRRDNPLPPYPPGTCDRE